MVEAGCSIPPSLPFSIEKYVTKHPYISMLETNCADIKSIQTVHAQLVKCGLARYPIAASRLLASYASPVGDIHYGCQLFKTISKPNIFMWNTLIRGFSESSTPNRAINFFIEMLVDPTTHPHHLTYPSVFKAYSQLGLVHEGQQLHGMMIKLGLENDLFIRNSILHMYSTRGYLCEARRLYDKSEDPDIVARNILVTGIARFGDIHDSRKLFEEMPKRNLSSWNSMVGGYVRTGMFSEALNLFSRMQREGVKPDEFTMVSLLKSCGYLGALEQGEWIHDYMLKNQLKLNSIVVTALIDMYSKCGSIDKACQVFVNYTSRKGLSCWNSMIIGLAMNGNETEAIELFSDLLLSDLKPDEVTFIGLLMACSHGGLVDKANEIFRSMITVFNIKPSIKHYSCMVDVLGRAGLVKVAEEFIATMSVEPDAILWATLLFWCQKHGYVETAKRVAKSLNELDPDETSSFLYPFHFNFTRGEFKVSVYRRDFIRELHDEKQPGCSSIETKGVVQEFTASDRLHPNASEIYELLDGCILE